VAALGGFILVSRRRERAVPAGAGR
jgi:hypothetical protein